MKTKLTDNILKKMGFGHISGLIQDSYSYIIEDDIYESDFPGLEKSYSYKAISISECNDKGQGEYYLFIRQGESNKRHEDSVVTITRNLQYKEDLEAFIEILKL